MPIEVFDCEQGTDEWFQARLYIPTASKFKLVMAGGDGKTRKKYMRRLVGERISGTPYQDYKNAHMERGNEMEPEARAHYEFLTSNEAEIVGFIRSGNKGCSPDGMVGSNGMLEIKTKIPDLQVEVLENGEIPNEHVKQIQGQLWVAEREWCDFVSYWPNMPVFIKRAYRDETTIAQIDRAVAIFNEELEELYEEILRRYPQ